MGSTPKNIPQRAAQTRSLEQLIGSDPHSAEINGDLETIVDDIADYASSPNDAGGNLIRLMILVRDAPNENARGLLVAKIIEYTYARQRHHYDSLNQYVESLFQESEGDK